MEEQRIRALKKAALSADMAQNLAHILFAHEKNVHLERIFIPETTIPLAWKIHNQEHISQRNTSYNVVI